MNQLLPQQRLALAFIFVTQALVGVAVVYGLTWPETFHGAVVPISLTFAVFFVAIILTVIDAERAARATWHQSPQPAGGTP